MESMTPLYYLLYVRLVATIRGLIAACLCAANTRTDPLR